MAIPKRTYTEQDFMAINSLWFQSEDQCPICLTPNEEADCKKVEMACRHVFCFDCVLQIPKLDRSRCSICRQITEPYRYFSFAKESGKLEIRFAQKHLSTVLAATISQVSPQHREVMENSHLQGNTAEEITTGFHGLSRFINDRTDFAARASFSQRDIVGSDVHFSTNRAGSFGFPNANSSREPRLIRRQRVVMREPLPSQMGETRMSGIGDRILFTSRASAASPRLSDGASHVSMNQASEDDEPPRSV